MRMMTMTDQDRKMMNSDADHTYNKIFKYFSNLSKSVKDISPVLHCHFGSVYIVTTEEGLDSKNFYAVVKDGIVSGYDIEFWKNSNQHMLILKVHLGMLEMEKLEDKTQDGRRQEAGRGGYVGPDGPSGFCVDPAVESPSASEPHKQV